MTRQIPALIVVCGAPASGKTTLARRLATDLHLPLLEKDAIKESLAGSLEAPDRDASRRIGAASFQLLYDLADAMLARGAEVMIEANLTRPYADAALARLSERSRLLIAQCVAEPAEIEQRYRARAAAGQRHLAHFDLDALPDLIIGLGDGRYDLSGLGHEGMLIDTNDDYRPGYDIIVNSVYHHLSRREWPPRDTGHRGNRPD